MLRKIQDFIKIPKVQNKLHGIIEEENFFQNLYVNFPSEICFFYGRKISLEEAKCAWRKITKKNN